MPRFQAVHAACIALFRLAACLAGHHTVRPTVTDYLRGGLARG